MKAKYYLVIGFILFQSHKSICQSENKINGQLWATYKLITEQHPKLDIGYRSSLESRIYPYSWWRASLNSDITYEFDSSIKVLSGINLINTNFKSNANTIELRLWIGSSFRFPKYDKFSLSHLFRIEERFIFSKSSSNIVTRLRYRLMGIIHLEEMFPYSFEFGTEFYLEPTESNLDYYSKIRKYYVGVSKSIEKNQLRLLVNLQKIRVSPETNQFTKDIILEFSYIHRLRKSN